MRVENSGGIYIHAAYCRMKCIYCDFYSVGDRMANWHDYVDALIAELNHRKDELPQHIRTIYIGGGTPSLMPREDFIRLCEALKPFSGEVEEFTIEVNPDDVNIEMFETWKQGGVNRLSIGIQSFNDTLLKSIRRRHSADSARNAYKLARGVFDNISIDLIFGLPGQSLEMWHDDIAEAIRLRPQHISAYSLMYEPGTPLTLLRDRGDIQEVPDSDSEEMLKMLVSQLKNAGYEHYEISNFAMPGFRSRHNSSYWTQNPYLGIGPSAHSYDGLRRRSFNRPDVAAYINYWNHKPRDYSVSDSEYLSDDELREEYILTRLRTQEGIDTEDFKMRFGDSEYKHLMRKSSDLLADGRLKLNGRNLSLSEDSILISDAIILQLA